MTISQIRILLRRLGSPAKARILQGFFKTGPGEYGEGDRFLGITVPTLRRLVASCDELPRRDLRALIRSPFHEERLLALLALVRRYDRGDEFARERIYRFYVSCMRWVNNWDLVDLSAPNIVGAHLLNRSRKPLMRLARSGVMWERRIAIVSTFAFIRRGEFGPTLEIAARLANDPEDLIHKAVGWMLREVGKRSVQALEGFLLDRYRHMPRTMLRYAIERLPARRRQQYLRGKIPSPHISHSV
jgi:3-methyladenine DNA glycosylase AlkD